MKAFTKKIVLENGREFYGYGFGADREAINEIVFNTSMVGYQEIMSDPSYTDQMVVMTYPLIGNYGMTDEDYETKTPTIGGMIVREYNDTPSNFRYTKTLHEVLEEHGVNFEHIPSGIDNFSIVVETTSLGDETDDIVYDIKKVTSASSVTVNLPSSGLTALPPSWINCHSVPASGRRVFFW